MKPRKPDRWERMVLEKTYPDMSVDKDDAIKLLRNEHAWMRRMVLAMYAIAEEMGLSKQGFKDLLIGQFAQRRK